MVEKTKLKIVAPCKIVSVICDLSIPQVSIPMIDRRKHERPTIFAQIVRERKSDLIAVMVKVPFMIMLSLP